MRREVRWGPMPPIPPRPVQPGPRTVSGAPHLRRRCDRRRVVVIKATATSDIQDVVATAKLSGDMRRSSAAGSCLRQGGRHPRPKLLSTAHSPFIRCCSAFATTTITNAFKAYRATTLRGLGPPPRAALNPRWNCRSRRSSALLGPDTDQLAEPAAGVAAEDRGERPTCSSCCVVEKYFSRGDFCAEALVRPIAGC